MNEALLADLLRVLDIAIVERLPNSLYHLVTPAPAWLAGAFEEKATGSQRSLGATLPFLDHFLDQAGAAWNRAPDGKAESGPFAATVSGEDVLLRATAITMQTRPLLIIERLTGDADTRPILQKAREHLLDREQLARQAAAVHAPAAAIDKAVRDLSEFEFEADVAAVVSRVQQASRGLQGAIAPLPVPAPKGRRTSIH